MSIVRRHTQPRPEDASPIQAVVMGHGCCGALVDNGAAVCMKPPGHDAPKGPQTVEDWKAVAWELTGALGLECNAIQVGGTPVIVVNPEAVKEWWDTHDHVNLVRVWKEHVDGS